MGQKDVGMRCDEGRKGQEIWRSNEDGVLIMRGKLRGVVYVLGARGRGNGLEGKGGRER